MARLNEATAPAESIDVLKRRFVRQNREIARVNSIQSLRIRTLESEVSHLLSENVSLREQTISLSQEIERYEAAKKLHDGVFDIKAKLESKLAELNSLVTDLGALPRKCGKLYDDSAESTEQKHSRLSNLDMRRAATDSEYNVALEEDGKLPVIPEDKCYPRKTLEPQELYELAQIHQDSPRSPEIEEVASTEREQEDSHFDAELPTPLTGFEIIDSDAEGIDTFLPSTLETRKKRKPSPIAMNKTEYCPDTEPEATNHNVKLNPGAKRKFMPEGEEEMIASEAVEEDDFQCSRPSHLQNQDDQSVLVQDENSPTKRRADKKRGSRESGSSKRKVLEPKSTNISAAPPQKFGTSKEQRPHENVPMQDEDRKLSAAEPKAGINHHSIGVNEGSFDHEPNRPVQNEDRKCLANRRSLKESPSSPVREMSQDEAVIRPSRRQRAIVSYAEPNLRDKMRRPTKQFADAVTGGNSRRASNPQSSRTSIGDDNEEEKDRNVNGKRSSHGADATDDATDSPVAVEPQELSPKHAMSMVSQRKRKTLPANHEDSSAYHSSKATAQTDPTCTRYRNAMHDEQEVEGTLADLENEITGRSEAQSASETLAIPTRQRQSTKSVRPGRRHSSNPKSSGRGHPSQRGANSTDFAEGTMLGFDESMVEKTDKDILDASLSGTPPDQSAPLRIDGRQNRRGQRVGARRKSMML